MIYRCDDFPKGFNIENLKEYHQEFVKRDEVLTLSILCSLLKNRQDLIDYINNHSHFSIQLHGWKHENYGLLIEEKIREDIEDSLEALKKHFNVKPTKWYLPWNGWVEGKKFAMVPRVREIAKDYGLDVDVVCLGVKSYLKGFKYVKLDQWSQSEGVETPVVYFHLWNDEKLLIKEMLDYKEKNEKHI